MAHNRKLVISGVALTKARISPKLNALAANRVRDELEREMIDSKFLAKAPFKWIGISIRYGLVDETTPRFENIDDNDGELPLAIEIDVNRLLNASEDAMAAAYRKITLVALIATGAKYSLPVDRLSALFESV
jgi:hypothetical protein